MKRAELSPAAEIEFRADWLNTEVQMKGLERKFRLSRGTIRRIASELGLPAIRQPTPLWPEGRAEEAARLYREEGLQCGEIAKRWGMTRNQVNSKLDRMGVLRRRVSEPTVTQARAASEAARAAAPKAPEVKRAPYQNAGLAFGTRKIAKAAKPKLMLLGNGTVAEKSEGKRPPEPPVRARVWQPLPGVEPVRLMDAEDHHCKWPLELGSLDHWCCGAVATERPAQPYCRTHGRIAQPEAGTKQRVDKRVSSDVRQAMGRAAA